ncbi:hypothetical protein B4U80_05272 [Leptotrombidium deliense]|uniref:Endothelin-converting enzyme 1-like protein n=1 Tax=Leptotrombidium deliense TaxID=299467 RepID=A0A443SKS4_9ACAR|nr:hypothetical protein B4U80_05272 [Leptotrombidium deliense]
MSADVESRETDGFTNNATKKDKHVSKSYDDLRNKNALFRIGIVVLIFIIIALLIITIVLAVVRFEGSNRKDDKYSNDPGTCYTEKCIETAKYLYDNMDLSVDPCEDFYNYTCNGWKIHNPRPAGETQWGVNTLVQNRLNDQILNKAPLSLQKARKFFQACTNTDFRDEYGLEQLRKFLKKAGGFPAITKDWSDVNFDWQNAFVYCDTHISVVKLFFSYKVDRQLEEDKTQFIELAAPDSFLVGSELINNETAIEDRLKVEKEFRQKFKQKLNNLNSPVSNELIERDLKALIDFDKQLATIVHESQEEDGSEPVVLTIEEMENEYKNVDWMKIFGEVFSTVKINITKSEKVYNKNPTFFKKIGQLLKDTPKRALANYIGYSIVSGFGSKAIYNWDEDDEANIDKEKLKKSCSAETEKFFRVAINYWYMKTELGEESMRQLKGFMKTIRAALTLTINTNKWMEEKTKQQAQLKMSKWAKHDELLKLRETSNREIAVPSEVNAYYSPYDNKIQILIGFLSPPNFYPGAPLAVNVPAIGSTIGHEVTHGFDDTGSQFDSKGVKHNWWDKRTERNYQDRVDCFVKQYSEFKDPRMLKYPIDGNNTIGENIADNGAIHQAFTAYKIYAALKHPENDLKLPNKMSQFTKDQLFFISYANTYCNDHSKLMMAFQALDVHSPDIARVIVPLQNSEQFAKAFQCKVGSRMNPRNKCILW